MHDHPPILEDSAAIWLLEPPLSVVLRVAPLQTLLDPEDVAGMLRLAGFRVLEDLSASEIRRRYLYQRSDGLDIPGFARLCCAERERAV
jgi:hypothetical protein